MSVFDNIRDKLLSYFNTNDKISSEWIKINDKLSKWTIEDFSYQDGVPGEEVENHCWKCVTINNCIFKNEEEKKPVEFDYSKYSYLEIPKAIRGLYHPHCHCKKKGVQLSNDNDIKMVIPKGKIEWLFRDKLHKMHEYGYHGESEWQIIDRLIFASANAFEQGSYKCNAHDKKGFKITIFATIPGINHRQGETFKIKAGYTIFPNGQLKCNTLWGGEWK